MSRPWRLGIAAAQVLFTLAFAVGVYIDATVVVPGLSSSPLSHVAAPAPVAASEREDRALTKPTISRPLVPPAPVAATVAPAIAFWRPVPVIGPSLPLAMAQTTLQAAALRPEFVAPTQSDSARPHARSAAPPFGGKDRSTPPRRHKNSH